MEEIDLKELLEFFKSKLLILIFITMGVCICGCVYSMFFQKPMYSSYATIILGADETASSSLSQSDVTLNKNLVDTYAEVVKSKRVLNQVIEKLDLNMSYSELNRIVSISSVNDTEIIKILVSDEDGIVAKNVANVTAEVFIEEVVNLYNLNNADILDEADVSKEAYNINVPKQTIIYFLIGFTISCAILFIIYYFDRTIKSVEQVEQKIKLPMLGTVQEYRGSGGK